MRVFLGFLVAAVCLAAAVYLSTHGLHVEAASGGDFLPGSGFAGGNFKYSWQDPLAIFLAVAGVGAGIAIAMPSFRSSATP